MRSILVEHTRRYPLWELADIYKLLHQAALGSEHAVAGKEEAQQRLIQELADLTPGPDEPLVDAISPDGEIARVHLRPFVSRRLDAGEGTLPCSAALARRFFDERRLECFAAAHHSQRFERTYKPAYRVVARRFLPEALGVG